MKKVLSAPLALALVVQTSTPQAVFAQAAYNVSCSEGFDVVAAPIPPLALKSLKTVANPVFPAGVTGALRPELARFIANTPAAIQLGKALFWEMQAGSDNKTACASCHFQAGADTRLKNQLNPGPNGTMDLSGSNATLAAANFPLSTSISTKADDVVGSQGVRAATFAMTAAGVESQVGVNTAAQRQVTGMNAPTTINAVHNHRNFFNGRAQADFNGVNPFGDRDTSLNNHVYEVTTAGITTPVITQLRDFYSLASQAVGPPLNSVEMSSAGRTFPDIGRKLLNTKPLKFQTVDTRDSVLGKLAETKIKGLKTTYSAMIEAAFQPNWWNTQTPISLATGNYTIKEANFSLYWGLAIMMYEATLVSDDSPMDQFLDGRTFTATGALKSEGVASKLNTIAKRLQTDYGYTGGVAGILNGLRLFENPLPPAAPGLTAGTFMPTGKECIACHLGATTTSASVANVVAGGLEPGDAALKAAGFDLRMERMFEQIPSVQTDIMALINKQAPKYATKTISHDPTDYTTIETEHMVPPSPTVPAVDPAPIAAPYQAPIASYDAGWYNVGVRPTPTATLNPNDDPGLGGVDGTTGANPLSWVKLLQKAGPLPKIPGGTLGCTTSALTYSGVAAPPILRDPLTGLPLFPDVVLNQEGFPLLSGFLKLTEANDVTGSFKTSQLRNVELTGPYFHNGGKATLRQVLDLYDDGGDFPQDATRNAAFPTDSRSPILKFYEKLGTNGMGFNLTEINDIIAFLIAFTDERVRLEKAPFDHPELIIPAGDNGSGLDADTVIPAVGNLGRTVGLKTFMGLNPFAF